MSETKVLVVTSEPITADQLRQAIGADAADAEVLVVAPALHASGLRFWVSDADEAIAHARWVAQSSVEALEQDGIAARGDTGESEPLDAVADVLVTFSATRIVLFAHGDGEDAQRYREEIESGELGKRFGIPVERAVIHG